MDLVTTTQRYLNLWSGRYDPPKWLTGFVNQWLPQLVVLLLVILLGQQAAHLTWRLVPLPPAQQNLSQPVSDFERPLNAESTAGNIANEIANLHLFGQAGVATDKAERAVDSKAPETNLNLTLHGVFAEDQPEAGAAIIGKAGSTQDYYRVGSEIMGGVKLQGVFQDKVVLSRSGRSEVLKFPKEIKLLGSVSEPRVEAAQGRENSLKAFRDQFKDEPLKIFQYVRFVPVRSGESLKGYRVLPQKNRELYNQLGLRPSDLVTGVNGVILNDDKEAMKLIEQLKDASQLNLEILRRGEPQSVSISLN